MNTDSNYNMPPIHEEETIDLRKWIGKLFANWYWFVLSVLVLGGAAYFYTRYLEPSYLVSSTLLIEDNNKAVGAEALFDEFNGGSGRKIDNQLQLLKSWTLARRTLDQVMFETSYAVVGKWSERQLYENIPFRVIKGTGCESIAGMPIYINILSDSTYQIRINGRYDINETHKFHEAIITERFSFVISDNPNFNINGIPDFMRTGDYYFKFNNLDRLATYYQHEIQAEWINQNTSVVKLSLAGFSNRKSTDYLNALMDEYIFMSLEEKNKTASNTVEFIDAQLELMADSVSIAAANLSEFRSKNDAIDLGAEGQAIYSRMENLNNLRMNADNKVKTFQNMLENLSGNKDLSDLVNAPSIMGFQDPSLTDLLSKLQNLYLEKKSLEFSARKSDFEPLQKVNLQIEDNISMIREKVKTSLEKAKEELEGVKTQVNQLKYDMRQLPEKERKLLNMQSSFQLKNEMYTFLLQRRTEAAIAEAANIPDQKIIDMARADAAVRIAPKNRMNYAIGAMLGLLLPLLIIVLIDFLNNKIREKEDVEKNSSVPVIGSVGHNKKDSNLPVISHGRSSIAESFRAIRTDLQFVLYKENKKVIMVTSTIGAEGKSFISLNLGGIFSVTGKKAVVVGLDMRKPVMHKAVNISNKEGVSTYIIGKSKLDDIIFPSEHENLFFIPAGPVAPNPAELIETPEFIEFIDELKARFDIIILDTPPVALVTDASLIAKHSDAILYIVRQNYTRKTSLPFIEKFAEKSHIKNLNIVINDVVVPKYYGYKYGYGYGYGYGKGYGSGYYVEK